MKILLFYKGDELFVEFDFEGQEYDSSEVLRAEVAEALWHKLRETYNENLELKKQLCWSDATSPPENPGTYLAGWFCEGKGVVSENYWTGSSWLGCDNEPVDVWRHMPELYTGG